MKHWTEYLKDVQSEMPDEKIIVSVQEVRHAFGRLRNLIEKENGNPEGRFLIDDIEHDIIEILRKL